MHLHHSTPCVQEDYHPYQPQASCVLNGLTSEEIWHDNDGCSQSTANNDADFSEGEPVQVERNAYTEDFSELQPVESQYLTFLMDYNADFACDMYTPPPTTAYECPTNDDCAGVG
ncbi:hypothetical protein OSTOST_15273 [Ostertagia ostertagi]